MNGTFSQRRLRWVSLGLVLAALAAPQAQARTGGQGTSVSRPGAGTAYRSDERLGPKYVRFATVSPAGQPVPAITIVKPAGFDVGDALLGAGAAAVAMASLAALFTFGGRVKGRRRSMSGVAVRP